MLDSDFRKILFLSLSCMVIFPVCSFGESSDDAIRAHQFNQLKDYEGFEDSAYYQYLKDRAEGTLPKDKETLNKEREQARKLALEEGSIDKLMALAKGGDTQAMIDLGAYYEVMENNKTAAHAWYRKAEDQDDQYSKYGKGFREIIEGKRNLNQEVVIFNKNKYGTWWANKMTPEEEAEAEKIYQEISKGFAEKEDKPSKSEQYGMSNTPYSPQLQTSRSVVKPWAERTPDALTSKNGIFCNEDTRTCQIQPRGKGNYSLTLTKE